MSYAATTHVSLLHWWYRVKANWFDARYGSRNGFARSKWHQFLNLVGRYRQDPVPWNVIDRLVFVCSGNICRSAFAEAVAKADGLNAISVGLHAIEDAPANEQAIKTAHLLGYDLSAHRTTPVMYPVLKQTDLLVVMEPWQIELSAKHLSRSHHAILLGLWGEPVRPYISDPFMRSPAYFEHCFNYIEKSVHAITAKLKQAG